MTNHQPHTPRPTKWTARNPEFEHAIRQIEWNRLAIFAREQRGRPQWLLAEDLAIHQSGLARLESGRHIPTIRSLARLAVETGGRLCVTLEIGGRIEEAAFDGAAFAGRRADLRMARLHEREARKLRERSREGEEGG